MATIRKEVEIELDTSEVIDALSEERHLRIGDLLDGLDANRDDVREWLNDDIDNALDNFESSEILKYITDNVEFSDVIDHICSAYGSAKVTEAIRVRFGVREVTDEVLLAALKMRFDASPFFKDMIKVLLS